MNKLTHKLLDEQTGDAGDSGSGAATKGRTIQMDDGRTVNFGEKQKIKKDYGFRDGNVFALIDFDNGKSVEVLVNPDSDVARAAMGHGLVQKLGDAAAGAENTEDALEAILEVANRLNAGVWNKEREGGGGSAKGASELVLALVEVLGKSKEEVREVLAVLSPAEKSAMRRVGPVAEAIEKIKAAKAPTKAESEKIAAAEALLAKMKGEPAAA